MNNRYSCLLPSTMHTSIETLKGLGFIFNNDIQDGKLVLTSLPTGWQYVSDARHCIVLIDEKGRKRASYLCQDSQSCIVLHERFVIHSEMLSDHCPCPSRVFVKDHATNKVLFVAGQYEAGQFKARDKLVIKASNYLDKHYPSWEDPTKYWD